MNQQLLSWMTRLAILLVAASLPFWAQTSNTKITGQIADTSDGPIPEAEVIVTDARTAIERHATTNEQGYYTVPWLTSGEYRIDVQREGFQPVTRSGVRLYADQALRVDFVLQVGTVTQAITVSGNVHKLDTEDAKLRHVVDQKQAQNLPLNARNLTHVLSLVPGVAMTSISPNSSKWLVASANLGPYAVNGSRGEFNAANVDGGYNQDGGNNVSQTNLVSPDFVEEVSIVTSGYSAEYGRNSGVQLNYATRSGTQEYHGAAWEFLQNDALNARSFFAPKVQKLRFNNFGWNLGGPVPLPGGSASNAKRLFFFAGQEYRRRIEDQLSISSTPSSAERSGIITSASPILYPSNFPIVDLRGQPIRDPSRATPANPTGQNIIPREYITANGQAIMNIYETAIGRAARYDDRAIPNNTTFQIVSPDIRREDFVKVDYSLPNSIDTLNYSMMYGIGSIKAELDTNYPTFGFIRRNAARTHRVGWTRILSPNAVNKVSAQVNHLQLGFPSLLEYTQSQRYGFAPKELFGNDIRDVGIPAIAIQGFSSIAGAQPDGMSPTVDFSFSDNFNYVRGAHNIKAGILAIRNRKQETVGARKLVTGNISFSPQGNEFTTGNGLADALLGNFRSWQEAESFGIIPIRYTQLEAYVTDNWKILPNLSIEAGIRFAYSMPPYSASNNVSTFDPTLYRPELAQEVIPSGPGAGSLRPGVGVPYNGIVIPGDQFHQNFESRLPSVSSPEVQSLFRGIPRNFYGNYSTWQPRLGFAYDPSRNGRFVVRGGAGVYTDVLPTGLFGAYGTNPPFSNTVQVLNGKLDDPSSGSETAKFPFAVAGIRRNIEPAVTWKGNFGIQMALPFDSILDTNYVTSQGRHLSRRVDINQVSPAQQVASPGIALDALRPYQGYGSILLHESSASSSYHGLQVGYTRRASSGFNYSFAYTYSKALDDASSSSETAENSYNYRAERSHSALDHNQIFSSSYVWDLPFWQSGQDWYKKAFGSWTVSGIVQAQTGAWLTPVIQTPTGTRRPDRIGELQYLDPRSTEARVGTDGLPVVGNFYLDPGSAGAFAAPPADRFGNSAPRVVRGPGIANCDLQLAKEFSVREAFTIRFRAEAFNVLNVAQFGNPNMNLSSRGFGTVTSSGPGRIVQFGVKVAF